MHFDLAPSILCLCICASHLSGIYSFMVVYVVVYWTVQIEVINAVWVECGSAVLRAFIRL